MEQFTLKLQSAKFISENTKHFVFKRTDDKALDFIPGQFLSLLIEKEGKIIKRNYSIANPPGSNTIEFSCSYIKGGLASEILFNMNIDDEIQAAAPFGMLILPKDKLYDNYYFFATGTGVTPCLSMLPSIEENILLNSKFNLIFGVRTKKDFIYKEELTKFANQNPNFNLHVCYSKESEDLLEYENIGRVQSIIDTLNISNNDISFLCGNPNMVDDVFTQLKELGIDRHNIKREKYISAKY